MEMTRRIIESCTGQPPNPTVCLRALSKHSKDIPGPEEGGGRSRAAAGDTNLSSPSNSFPLSLITPNINISPCDPHPKLFLIFKAAFSLPPSCLIPHLILNLIHNRSFSLLPPCVTTFFLSIFFPFAPISICVWKRREAKLMANPKLFYRMRRRFPVWRAARERSFK